MKNIAIKKVLIVLCCVTGAVFATGGHAHAANSDPVQQSSVGLEGIVPTNPPTTAATITLPLNGQTFTQLPIKVSGLCSDGLLVKLFKNGVFGGSAQCSGGIYSITTDLFNGTNELIARVYDALDQAGPDSNKLTVTFTETGFNNSATRVLLTSNFAKKGADPGETITWPVILSGGTGPYAVSVDWGDGKNTLLTQAFPGSFDIKHAYDSSGIYTVLIKVTDSAGNSAFLQLSAVANGALSQDNTKNIAPSTSVRTAYVWWPLIVAGVMICFSFWLGARYQLGRLRDEAEKHIQI